ncbi:S8 family serine peptidase [Dehalogenimonas alkenigignens]|uniref:S8 family serine peptidase n=1 Tax=Dehalogenimonas alkenigignens TaxID=1217799 RepID=UPI000D57902D|nr:S8 family serine peptidase [Dehalogenimonas alkenigignens]PVV85116.1 peptidase S8 [Dehalogenimonas alkenigignens]
MKILKLAIMAALTLILSTPVAALAAAQQYDGEDLVGQDTILVAFRPGAAASDIAALHRQSEAHVSDTIPGIGVQVLTFSPGKAAGMLKVYQNNPNVLFAEYDYTAAAEDVPNDPSFPSQWGLAKVNASQAWSVTTGSGAVVIAILDTGIDMNHPDLAGKIKGSINFSTSATESDVKGHGTHVAGIAAAITNNSLGVAGLGYNASLLNVKVLGDDGYGSYSGMAKGIIWAADNGASVINMSLSGTSASSTLESAVNYAWSKGVMVVCAAGNNGNSTPVYPGYYANAVAVAATDSADRLASYSDYGSWVDLAAPGSNIYSTLMNGAYGYKSGTSMATPFVAGLAALVMSRVADTNGNGRLNDEARDLIEATCDNIGVSGIGGGRINAAQAVAGLSQPTVAAPPPATEPEPGTSPVPGTEPIEEGPVSEPEPAPTPAPAPEQPVVKPMWVDAVTFTVSGKNLVIKAKVISEAGAVAGASVSMTITTGSQLWQLKGTTDSAGLVTFTLSKAVAGTYLASVTMVSADGYEWDTDNGINLASYIFTSPANGKSNK